MLRVEKMTRRYGSLLAVDNISFEVPSGLLAGFLGPNGAGKTTTIRALAGTLEPDSGRVIVAGIDAARDPIAARRAVGYLPENNPLYEDSDVGEHLEWIAASRGFVGAYARKRTAEALERCALGDLVDRPIGTLSHGQRQRVGLAQAILPDPPVLILDEPTSGLDPKQAAEIRGLIVELKASKTVLLSTHVMSEAQSICDRVVIINGGRIVAEGDPDMLSASPGSRLRLLLGGRIDAAAVERLLRRIPGVTGASSSSHGGEWEIIVSVEPDRDVRADVSGVAAREGWPLLELSRTRIDLEETFRRVTT